MGSTVLVSAFVLGWVLVLASWVGLGCVKKNGPTSISEPKIFAKFDRGHASGGQTQMRWIKWAHLHN